MKLKDINASRFTRQIDIYSMVKSEDTAGGYDLVPSEYMTGVWCEVLPWKSWDMLQVLTEKQTSTVALIFVMHYDSGINTNMVIKYNDDELQVREIENVEAGDWFLALKCTGLKK